MPDTFIALLTILGGILPALVWLTFWLLEDRCEPEPKLYIFLSFIAGMAAVIIVLPLERSASTLLSGTLLLLAWVVLEELFKFAAAYAGALHANVFDEPLDAVIYMVTAALGFSAMENIFFLWGPAHNVDLVRTIVTGDLRFMGATLVHTLSSVTIGLALAYAFNKSAAVKKVAAVAGVILAITLHTLFNFFILNRGGGATFWIFLCVWVGIIASLLLVERIKQPTRDYC